MAQHAAAHQLYDWIVALPTAIPGPFAKVNTKQTFAPNLANALLARKEPLIDIAIAKSCDDHDTLLTLWGRGDEAIRYAIAANPYRIGYLGFDPDTISELFRQPDEQLMRLVFTNPSMTSSGLATLFDRDGAFSALDDTVWLRAVHAASTAPVLTSAEPLEACFQESLGFAAAWRLVDTLEPTIQAAEVLEQLLLNIKRFSPPLEKHGYGANEARQQSQRAETIKSAQQLFVVSALQKWRRENAPGAPPPLREFEPDFHGGVRTCLARAATKAWVLVEELLSSDDRWTRLGAYGGAQAWTEDLVDQAYGRDGADFLREAVSNSAFHERGAVRDKLKSLIAELSTNAKGDTPDAFDTKQDLRSTFRTIGERLWKRDHHTYALPHDDTLFDQDTDARHDYELTLTERIEKLERNIRVELRHTAIFYQERIEASGATREEAENQVAPLWTIRDAATRLASGLKQIANVIEAQQQASQLAKASQGLRGTSVWTWIAVFTLGFLVARFVLN
ncbi:MAG: hypothetical protein INF65_13675 [Roseomonas sp.]|nr:hypothetical protein [Roseomonas sp.]MCA3407184.1 hypothetical protein [Roseomonas sp.]